MACRVRLKLFTLDRGLILEWIGMLSVADRQRVVAGLRSALALD